MRRWLSVLVASILLSSVWGNAAVISANADRNSQSWESSTGVALDKEWTISFSQDINKGLILDDFIYVVDVTGEKVNSRVFYDALAGKIRVQAPVEGYAPKSDYELIIEEGLQSKSKKKLTGSVSKYFTTGTKFSDKSAFVPRATAMDDLVLEGNVKVLDKKHVLSEDYDKKFVLVDSSATYTAGEIIVLPATNQYPFGYAAKVASALVVTGGSIVKFTEPKMDEVVRELDISKEVAVQASDVRVLAAANTAGLLQSNIKVVKRDRGFSIQLQDVGFAVKGKDQPLAGVKNIGDAGMKLSGTIDFDDAVTTLDIKKLNYLAQPIVNNVGFTADQTVHVTAEMYGQTKADMKFPLAEIPVKYASVKGAATIQAGVFVKLFLVVTYDANGVAQFSVSQEYESTTGLNMTAQGTYQPYSTFTTEDPEFIVGELSGELAMDKGVQVNVAGSILQWDLVSLHNKGTNQMTAEKAKLFNSTKNPLCYDFDSTLHYQSNASVWKQNYSVLDREYTTTKLTNCELTSISFVDKQVTVEAGEKKSLEVFGKLADGSKVDLILPNDAVSFSSTNPAVKVDSSGNISVAEDVFSDTNTQITMRYKTSTVELEKSLSFIIHGVESEEVEMLDMTEKIVREIGPDEEKVFSFVPSAADLQMNSHAVFEFDTEMELLVFVYTSKENLENEISHNEFFDVVKIPLAFEGPYYIKVMSFEEEAGEVEIKPSYEEFAPEILGGGDEECPIEMIATDATVVQKLQVIRDEYFVKSEQGKDITALYNKLSPTIVWSLLKSSTLRQELLSDLNTIHPVVDELYKVAKGQPSNYVITDKEAKAIQRIVKTVSNYLPKQQVAKLEVMKRDMKVDQMANKKLSQFLEGAQLTDKATGRIQPGELIIKLNDQTATKNPKAQIQSMLSLSGASASVQVESLHMSQATGLANTFVVNVKDTGQMEKVLTQLNAIPAIDYVELNQLYSTQTADVGYFYQWPLENEYEIAGGDLQFNAILQETKKHKMKDVIVAVVDTGVNHELADFKNIVLADKGYDFVNDDDDAMDDNDHGTHVAGIIAAQAGNGYSIAGLNQHTKILPVKVLDGFGYGTSKDISRGIIYAVDNGAQVINLSLGTDLRDQTIERALAYATSRNVIVVAATGNDFAWKISYPASSKHTIAVGATTEEAMLADFSNMGRGIDLVAPGELVPSLTSSGEVMYASGTSMATPYAAAQIALLLSVKQDLNKDSVLKLLESHHIDLGEEGYDTEYGWGMFDTVKALQSLK